MTADLPVEMVVLRIAQINAEDAEKFSRKGAKAQRNREKKCIR